MGVALLVVLALLLGVTDLYVWATRGVLPGEKLLVAGALCVGAVYYAVRTARAHPPSR
ncbi:hypothetical protein K933_10527 [Candidatus Halobonum tyrrellensis G22]|uniref:Uncharacterized protein n=1 Tax=Candidatus Halobonum tyrrellensis G22 TaxID=1324957 RepID=V4HJM4_9EURY|nr:hypothetical protein K933_10527 [Candidatus Halobonum tyrrellensis G22]